MRISTPRTAFRKIAQSLVSPFGWTRLQAAMWQSVEGTREAEIVQMALAPDLFQLSLYERSSGPLKTSELKRRRIADLSKPEGRALLGAFARIHRRPVVRVGRSVGPAGPKTPKGTAI